MLPCHGRGSPSEIEHGEIQRMEARKRYELEFVAHCTQFTLEDSNFAELRFVSS